MPSNLELKVRIASIRHASSLAFKLGARRGGVLAQTDTYYRSPSGRLKVRETQGKQSELIYYHRRNFKGNRYSDYRRIPIEGPREMKGLLADLLGVLCVVKKERRLFLYKNSRIHLDTVQGLGNFLEFEVLVTNGKRQARTLMKELWKALEIRNNAVVAGSYSDLLQRAGDRKKF